MQLWFKMSPSPCYICDRNFYDLTEIDCYTCKRTIYSVCIDCHIKIDKKVETHIIDVEKQRKTALHKREFDRIKEQIKDGYENKSIPFERCLFLMQTYLLKVNTRDQCKFKPRQHYICNQCDLDQAESILYNELKLPLVIANLITDFVGKRYVKNTEEEDKNEWGGYEDPKYEYNNAYLQVLNKNDGCDPWKKCRPYCSCDIKLAPYIRPKTY